LEISPRWRPVGSLRGRHRGQALHRNPRRPHPRCWGWGFFSQSRRNRGPCSPHPFSSL